MYRLQAVPDIGQSARYNDRHRVVDVCRFHLVFDVDGDDPVVCRNEVVAVFCFFSHYMFTNLKSKGTARPCIACLVSMRRSEEHTSELQSLMRISYAVFCLKKK